MHWLMNNLLVRNSLAFLDCLLSVLLGVVHGEFYQRDRNKTHTFHFSFFDWHPLTASESAFKNVGLGVTGLMWGKG